MFWSAQGEGSRCGMPSIFVRLTGCRTRCPYCDTRRAWSDGRETTPGEIAEQVSRLKKRFPVSQVVITGGEPLEQDMTDLVARLRQEKIFIAVETNGLDFQDLAVDWWSVSPKDVTGFFIHPRLIPEMDEVKLIVNRNLTLDVVRKIRRRAAAVPIFLQPQFFHRDKFRRAFLLYEASQRDGISDVRLGFQLQTMFGIR